MAFVPIREYTADDLRYLRRVLKGEHTLDPQRWISEWLDKLEPKDPTKGADKQHTALVHTERKGRIRGSFYLYARQSVTDPMDFSAGMFFKAVDEPNASVWLVRCNGWHLGEHKWRIPGRVGVIPPQTTHIHYTTATFLRRYNQKRGNKDMTNWAVRTQEYNDLEGALATLGRRCTIITQGVLGGSSHRIPAA